MTAVPIMLREMLSKGALKERLEIVCALLPSRFGLANLLALFSDVFHQQAEKDKANGATSGTSGGVPPVRLRGGLKEIQRDRRGWRGNRETNEGIEGGGGVRERDSASDSVTQRQRDI